MSSRPLSLGSIALLVALALPQLALANGYVSSDTADWFRYRDPGTQQELDSQIQLDQGNWKQWSNFGGLGTRWVYTDASNDWLWIWNGREAQLVGDLERGAGWQFMGELDAVNKGGMRVESVGGTLTTPAGQFPDVTKLALDTQSTDAGVTAIWFAKGVGIVKWEQQSIAGPQTYELVTAMVGGQMLPSATTPPPPPTPGTNVTVSPGEHEASDVILWGCNDTYLVVDTYADSFTALDGQTPRMLSQVAVTSQSVASQLRYEMTQRSVPMGDVELLVVALDSVWMRDYGPVTLRDPNGQRVIADLDYYYNRTRDDAFPQAYATYRGMPRVHVDLSYEGGNFISDGRGQGFSSTGVLRFNSLSQAQVEARFEELGCDRVEFFRPLINEGTTHIDMFAKILSDTHALVSDYPSNHRQKPVVDEAAQKMAALGYTVERAMVATSHDEFATYANSLIASDLVLVPQYGNATLDRQALDAYARAGVRAVGVDCRNLIRYGGAVHCISMQIPR